MRKDDEVLVHSYHGEKELVEKSEVIYVELVPFFLYNIEYSFASRSENCHALAVNLRVSVAIIPGKKMSRHGRDILYKQLVSSLMGKCQVPHSWCPPY
jgi:hypothetical protein